MTTQEVKRKLTAILSADVKGYSRLMGEDEKGTVRTLNAYREVMANLIQQHHGRLVDSTGDNLMAEFASVVDAVECAVEIQKELKTRNAEFPENRRMEFRIGINLGDVIEEEGRIYGDGVNIAARIESLSEAGGVCISGSAFDFVGKKLPLGYEYLGEHTVKNIEKPVRVYRVLMEPEEAGKVVGEKKAKPIQWQRAGMGLVAAVIVVVAAVVIWKLYTPSAPQPEVTQKGKIVATQPEKPPATTPPSPEVVPKEKLVPSLPEKVSKPTAPPAPKVEVASKEKMAFPLPDKPSIAVLAFDNMSGDPKQEFFSDGITESIIAALSKVPRLFVIARNSTFTYKGKPVKVKQVSEELGVRYVLEGSIQRSGDSVRITAQLIDALTGDHLWAERYDRDLKDIFALQDEITIKILTAIRVKLTDGEISGPGKFYRGKQGLDCYLKVLEASEYIRRLTIQDNNLARQRAEEAISMCPEVPAPYVCLGWIEIQDYWFGNTKSPQETIEKAIELAHKVLALDDSIAEPHALLSALHSLKREYDKAIAEGERGVALLPNGANAQFWYAESLRYACRPEEAIPVYQKAIRLSPLGWSNLFQNYAHALRNAGRFEEAVSAFKKALQLSPNNYHAHYGLAATYILMGREKEARLEAAEVLRINPKFSVDYLAKTLIYKDQSVKDNVINALRKAGLK